MKKMYYLLAAVAVLAVAGCAKEKELTPASNTVKLHATVGDTDTRISIDNAYAYAFQSGDKISVLTDGGQPVEFTAADGGTSVDFNGTMGTGEAIGSYAMYPASENHMADGDEILFSLNEELTWAADVSNMPMLGKIDEGAVTFKAVGGVLKLIVYNIPATAAYLQFTATNKQISGEFTIADASVDSPVIETANKSGSNDTMFIDFSENYSTNKVFYIPLPTGTIDGFTISFLDSDFVDITGASKTTTANLNVTRNKIIIAPALNMAPATEIVLWSEDFTTNLTGSGNGENEIVTIANYNNEKLGQVVASGTVNYSNEGTSTSLYKGANLAEGNNVGELFLAKKNNNDDNGVFLVSGIEPNNASTAELSFLANNTSMSNVNVSSTNVYVTITGRTISGNKITYSLSIPSTVTNFDLVFTNSSSKNTRIDDIVLKATVGTAPVKPTINAGDGSATIGAGQQSASINGVTLVNGLDNLGISASTDADWLSVAFTEGTFENGAKLTATASSYNHESTARTATVTLRATGVTKTVTFKQNPSLVHKPTIAVEPGNKTFTVSWTGDSKVASYVAYYSANVLTTPPTGGIALSVSNSGTAYTAVPSETLNNGTEYFIYVKASTLTGEFADKYAIVDEWAEASVEPIGIYGSIDDPYTPADAIAVISTLTAREPTSEFYYVEGILDANPTYFGNGQLSFSFVDSNGNNQIKAYNCKGLNGANFTSISDLKSGDYVIVYGNLEKYVSGGNTTNEIVNGQLAQLIPYVAPGNEIATLTLSSNKKFATTSGSTLTDDKNNTWTVTTTKGAIQNSYQSAYNGQQFGTSSATWSGTFSSSISGTISKVVVNANTGGSATLSVSVGGTAFTCSGNTVINVVKNTSSANSYEFTGSASGNVVISLSGTSKACYFGGVAVIYSN